MAASQVPLIELETFIAEHPRLKAEYVSESPGWAQVFVSRRDKPPYDKDDEWRTQPVVVITNDDAEWCVALFNSAEHFYSDENNEPIRSVLLNTALDVFIVAAVADAFLM